MYVVSFFKMIDKNLTENMTKEMKITILDFDEDDYEYVVEHKKEARLSSFEFNFTFSKTLYKKMLQITFHNNSRVTDIYGIPLSNYTMEIPMENVEIPTSMQKNFDIMQFYMIWGFLIILFTICLTLYFGR